MGDFRTNHPRGKEVKPAAALKEFALIRQQGFTWTESGWSNGINSLAAAILGRDGLAVAAIAIAGPAERLTRQRMESLADQVLNACTQAGDSFLAGRNLSRQATNNKNGTIASHAASASHRRTQPRP